MKEGRREREMEGGRQVGRRCENGDKAIAGVVGNLPVVIPEYFSSWCLTYII